MSPPPASIRRTGRTCGSSVRLLRDGGTTIFLTTHYLDEADQLCDRVAIVDHGRVIALGSPDQLKQRYSADTIAVTTEASASLLDAVARELADAPFIAGLVVEAGTGGHGTIRLTATDATRAMAAVFDSLASRGVPTRAASVARPTLDDVFLRETGRSLRDAGTPAGAAALLLLCRRWRHDGVRCPDWTLLPAQAA